DAALADVLPREQHPPVECRRRGVGPAFLDRRALARAPQQFEQRALRGLRRAAQAAVLRVNRTRDAVRGAIELGEADDGLAGGPRLFGEPRHQGVAILADAVGFLAKQPRDLA